MRTHATRMAANHLRGQVALDRTLEVPAGSVEVWRTVGRSPSRIVAYHVSASGTCVRMSASGRSFAKAVAAAHIDLEDVDTLTNLVRLGPGIHLVPCRSDDVPEAYRMTDWWPKATITGWQACCRDAIAGRWKRILLRTDYSVEVEDIGPAPRSWLR